MKKAAVILATLMASSAFAGSYCPTGQVLTEDGCKRVIQQQDTGSIVSQRDPRLKDPRCFDDGMFDPYEDECVRAYPGLAHKNAPRQYFDDDRYELWDD